MRALIVVVLLSSCATTTPTHRLECTAHGGRPVLRLESEHFEVIGEFPAPLLRAETRKLEQLWDAWVAFFGANPATTAKLQVVLARQGASSEFIDDTSGFVRHRVPAQLFSTLYTRGEGEQEVAYASSNAHELVHLVTVFWLPRQPRWIAEGLADYLEDAKFTRDDVVRMGAWKDIYSYSVATLEELWAWDEMRETGERQRFMYASAGAWVHYLSNRDEARLAALWKALAAEPSPKQAFTTLFPQAEWSDLHARVEEYLRIGRFRAWEVKLNREPSFWGLRTLAPWEVHLLRRQLLEDSAAKRAELRAAQALSTGQEPPPLTLARFDDRVGPDRSEVLDVLPDDPQAQRIAATAVDRAPRERFELLQRSVAGAPTDANALAALCWSSLGRPSAPALASSEKAIALAPWWSSPYFCRVRALSEQGRCADAARGLDQLLGLVVDGDTGLRSQIDGERKLLDADCKERK
jgi:hypothetical protein